jgi:hypothetical protein
MKPQGFYLDSNAKKVIISTGQSLDSDGRSFSRGIILIWGFLIISCPVALSHKSSFQTVHEHSFYLFMSHFNLLNLQIKWGKKTDILHFFPFLNYSYRKL